jgi:hypothetical protein
MASHSIGPLPVITTKGPASVEHSNCLICYSDVESTDEAYKHPGCPYAYHALCWDTWRIRAELDGQPRRCCYCRQPLAEPIPGKFRFMIAQDKADLRDATRDLEDGRSLEDRKIKDLNLSEFVLAAADRLSDEEDDDLYIRRVLPRLIGARSFALFDFLEHKTKQAERITWVLVTYAEDLGERRARQQVANQLIQQLALAKIQRANRAYPGLAAAPVRPTRVAAFFQEIGDIARGSVRFWRGFHRA